MPIETSLDVEAFLLGSWTICARGDETPVFGPDVIGVEFGQDGHFRELVRGPDGRVARREPPTQSTWRVLPIDEGSIWSGRGQIDVLRGGFQLAFLVQPFSTPQFAYLNQMGVEEIGLLQGAPADAPVTPTTTVPPTVTLPATGASGPFDAPGIAVALMGVGGATWLLARRRRLGPCLPG